MSERWTFADSLGAIHEALGDRVRPWAHYDHFQVKPSVMRHRSINRYP